MRARIPVAMWMALAAASVPAAAYYHYNHYLPQGVVPEKFDLNSLPNRTVTFFVSDSSPTQYAPNDSFASVLSQVRQAAQAWNGVESSNLRVAFGGLISPGTQQRTPAGMVVFEDIPPGWVAFSTRTTLEPAAGPAASFVPIAQGTVHLNRDMARRPGPSYLEGFFTTVLHEMGHALGLQHTFTSSAMSTAVTRSTSRTRPLDADDIAGISLLYPTPSFAASFGSISGRVTSGGQPVHMASVVALRPAGSAVSTLTNPDGTYRIDGLPPDSYWVYVHPLPPTADIELPKDAAGQPVAPTGPIETLFYPGTRDPRQFAPVMVTRGSPVAGIDFFVQRRSEVPIYDVGTYSYVGQTYLSPAYLNVAAGSTATLVARGNGITAGANVAPGLGVQVLGGFASIPPGGLQAYGAPSTALAIYLNVPLMAGTGPRHILFTLPDDAYVLPSALTLVQRMPPAISALSSNPDGTVTVAGSNMNSGSRVLFDGLAAQVRAPFTGSDLFGTLTVMPPPGASNQTAAVAVYNPDGQNSLLLQAQNPAVYTYGFADPPFAASTPPGLPAGASAMVEINGVNTRFVDGQTTLGFGSSDIFVRRLWVLSPTRLLANVTVAADATPGSASPLSVISGFQVAVQPFGFQVQPANPRLPSVALPVVNANTNQSGLYPGATVTAYGSNLALAPGGTTVTINDQPAQVLFAGAGQVNFVVPAGTPLGPAVVRVHNGAEASYPVVIQVDAAPPTVSGVTSSANQPVDVLHPAMPGDVLNVLVSNVDASVMSAPGRLRVHVGGVEMQALAVLAVPDKPGTLQAQIILSPVPPGPAVPLAVSLDGGTPSAPVYIAVR